MPYITFIQPDGTQQSVEAPLNWSLMQIARHHNIEGIVGRCGGSMVCTTCHVHIHPDWWNVLEKSEENEQSEEELDILQLADNLNENSRLSCQIVMSEELDGLILTLPGTRK